MKLVKTIRFKLDEKVEDFYSTFSAYTNAFNYICKVGFLEKKSHSIDLHNLTYHEVRNTFNLTSQLACSVRNKASEALNGLKKKKLFNIQPKAKKFISIRYDKNSLSINFVENKISISTLDGRKHCKLIISDYQKKSMFGWKPKSSDLVLYKNKLYLHTVFEKDITDMPTNGTFVGLDRGISNIAVLSNNTFYTGKKVKQISNRYQQLRKKLQQKGTKSAKRHLKKLSGKEKRFKADINHKISKQIIQSLNPGSTLVIEDLKGIREKRLRKAIRTLINNWSFYQLEQFLQYKADAAGIQIVKVKACYTSQKCSRCGFTSKNNRKTQARFACKSCGFELNADLNASRNICMKAFESYKLSNGVAVNQPIVPDSSNLGTSPCL